MSRKAAKLHSKETTTGMKAKAIKIASRHPQQILETDAKGHIWCDGLTLALEMGRSPHTWASQLVHEAERFVGGDRNVFRKVRGRIALWDATMILNWWQQRQRAPVKTNFMPAQKTEARGDRIG
jgi:hypothetical protein